MFFYALNHLLDPEGGFERLGFQCIHDLWASTRENLSSGVCEQQRCRPACASAQTGQRLCCLRFAKYHI